MGKSKKRKSRPVDARPQGKFTLGADKFTHSITKIDVAPLQLINERLLAIRDHHRQVVVENDNNEDILDLFQVETKDKSEIIAMLDQLTSEKDGYDIPLLKSEFIPNLGRVVAIKTGKFTRVRFEDKGGRANFIRDIAKELLKLHREREESFQLGARHWLYVFGLDEPSEAIIERRLDDLCCLLQAPREDIGVAGESKGFLAGLITYRHHGVQKDANITTSGLSLPIPTEISKVTDIVIDENVSFIIVAENLYIFKFLVDDKFAQRHPCVMVATQGDASYPAKRFISLIARTFRLPTFVVVDANPSGLRILSTMKYGSDAMNYDSKSLAIPCATWLGVKLEHISEYGVPYSQKRPYKDKDEVVANSLLRRNYIPNDWREEVGRHKEGKITMEAQGLTVGEPKYFTYVYLSHILQKLPTWNEFKTPSSPPPVVNQQGRTLERAIREGAQAVLTSITKECNLTTEIDDECFEIKKGASAVLRDIENYPLNDIAKTFNQLGLSLIGAMKGGGAVMYTICCHEAYKMLRDFNSTVTPKQWANVLEHSVECLRVYMKNRKCKCPLLDVIDPASKKLSQLLAKGVDPCKAYVESIEAAKEATNRSRMLQADSSTSVSSASAVKCAAAWFEAAVSAVKIISDYQKLLSQNNPENSTN